MHYIIRTLARLLLLAIAAVVFTLLAIVEFIFYLRIPFTKEAFVSFKAVTYKRKAFQCNSTIKVIDFLPFEETDSYKMIYYKNVLCWLFYVKSYCVMNKKHYNKYWRLYRT